jgi:HSP20 family protein
LRDWFNSLVDRFFGDPGSESLGDFHIIHQERAVVVRVKIPGFKAVELDVHLQGILLILRACKRIEAKRKKRDSDDLSLQETFRCAPMPSGLDATKAKATYCDGVLTVTLPKTAKSQMGRILVEGSLTRQPARTIEVARGTPRRLRNDLPKWPPHRPEKLVAPSSEAIRKCRAHVEHIKPRWTARKKEPIRRTGGRISLLQAWRNLKLP